MPVSRPSSHLALPGAVPPARELARGDGDRLDGGPVGGWRALQQLVPPRLQPVRLLRLHGHALGVLPPLAHEGVLVDDLVG